MIGRPPDAGDDARVGARAVAQDLDRVNDGALGDTVACSRDGRGDVGSVARAVRVRGAAAGPARAVDTVAEAAGKGAASLDGKMIDAASEKMARNVIDAANAIAAKATTAA